MNRKKQLLDLIAAMCRNMTTQELKIVRDTCNNIEDKRSVSDVVYCDLCGSYDHAQKEHEINKKTN